MFKFLIILLNRITNVGYTLRQKKLVEMGKQSKNKVIFCHNMTFGLVTNLKYLDKYNINKVFYVWFL